MDFTLSEEQRDIQKAAQEFAQGEFDADLALELDREGRFPEAIRKKACQLGFIGLGCPEEFGGQGLGQLETVLVTEEFCRRDSSIGCALSLIDFGSHIILKFGTDQQKRRWIPSIMEGRAISSWASMEDMAADLVDISTSCLRKGEECIIEGTKEFVVNGPIADYFVVLCGEGEGNGSAHTLLSHVVVERDRDGIEITPVEKMGMRMVPMARVQLTGVRVPIENMVGKKGDGHKQAHDLCGAGGLVVAAQALGSSQGAFDRALDYSRQRVQFGKKLSQFQAIRHKLADMATRIEAARWLTYRAAAEYDEKGGEFTSIPIARLYATEAAVDIADEAVQIFGGYGYIVDQDIEHFFRDAWVIDLYGAMGRDGRDEIAEALLGNSSKGPL
jgi:alkylation response protein AidB-like acyl-CoA dehydrogenase